MKHIFYLGGDSYPADADIEDLMASALEAFFAVKGVRQSDLLATSNGTCTTIASRLAQLTSLIDGLEGDVLLVGRSSGARVVSKLANHPQVCAVICLAYPFKHPNCDVEADRFEHLATTQTPLLILQGKQDPYGGERVDRKFSLSKTIQVHYLNTDHDMHLTLQDWEAVLSRVIDFAAAAQAARTRQVIAAPATP